MLTPPSSRSLYSGQTVLRGQGLSRPRCVRAGAANTRRAGQGYATKKEVAELKLLAQEVQQAAQAAEKARNSTEVSVIKSILTGSVSIAEYKTQLAQEQSDLRKQMGEALAQRQNELTALKAEISQDALKTQLELKQDVTLSMANIQSKFETTRNTLHTAVLQSQHRLTIIFLLCFFVYVTTVGFVAPTGGLVSQFSMAVFSKFIPVA